MIKPKQPKSLNLALFDFDGTLTTRDSFMAFLKFTHSRKSLLKYFLYLWPILILYKLKIIKNTVAKQTVFKHLYQNWKTTIFLNKSTDFCEKVLPEILNQEAIAKLEWHQTQGHRVIVVTAMFKPILQPWCDANNIELVATELEIKGNSLTGNFSTPNCYGAEKVNRIKEAGIISNDSYIFAYGDSKGDKELLAIAHKPFFRKFS